MHDLSLEDMRTWELHLLSPKTGTPRLGLLTPMLFSLTIFNCGWRIIADTTAECLVQAIVRSEVDNIHLAPKQLLYIITLLALLVLLNSIIKFVEITVPTF